MKKKTFLIISSIAIYVFFFASAFTPVAINHRSVSSACTGEHCAPTGIRARNYLNPIIFAPAPFVKGKWGTTYKDYSALDLDAFEIRKEMILSPYVEAYWVGVSFVAGAILTICYSYLTRRHK